MRNLSGKETKKSILTTKGAKNTKKGLLALSKCLDMNENLNPVNLVNPV